MGWRKCMTCLLYTSDAADEEDSVDLGGRGIIKKKKTVESGDVGMVRRIMNMQIDTESLNAK